MSFNATDSPRELKKIATSEPVKAAADSYFGDPYLSVSVGPMVEVYELSAFPDSDSSNAITMETIETRVLPSSGSG